MTRYISQPDQAKMIREALKVAFPGFKFSIRSRRGSSIDVSWVDGPTKRDVDSITAKFKGGYFDGMSDYAGSHVHTFKGEKVSFIGDYIFCHRELSPEFVEEVKAFTIKGRDLSPQHHSKMLNATGAMGVCRNDDDLNNMDVIARHFANTTSKVFIQKMPELPVIISSH